MKEEKPLGQRIAFSFLAWLLILVVTTAYHLGYSDFRSKKIIQPNLGNTIISVPTLVSANPIGVTNNSCDNAHYGPYPLS